MKNNLNLSNNNYSLYSTKNNPNEFQKKKRTLNGIHLGIISYKYISSTNEK